MLALDASKGPVYLIEDNGCRKVAINVHGLVFDKFFSRLGCALKLYCSNCFTQCEAEEMTDFERAIIYSLTVRKVGKDTYRSSGDVDICTLFGLPSDSEVQYCCDKIISGVRHSVFAENKIENTYANKVMFYKAVIKVLKSETMRTETTRVIVDNAIYAVYKKIKCLENNSPFFEKFKDFGFGEM